MFALFSAALAAAPVVLTTTMATNVKIALSVKDLAAGSAEIEFDQPVAELREDGKVCATTKDAKLKLGPSCPGIWRLPEGLPKYELLDAKGRTYALTFVQPDTLQSLSQALACSNTDAPCQGAELRLLEHVVEKGGKKVAEPFPNPPDLSAVYYYDYAARRWVASDHKSGVQPLGGKFITDANVDLTGNMPPRIRAVVQGDREISWSFTKLDPPGPPPPSATTCDIEQGKVEGSAPYVLCVDLSTSARKSTLYSRYKAGSSRPDPSRAVSTSNILLPNLPVVVIAIVPTGGTVKIGGDGTIGLAPGEPDKGGAAGAPPLTPTAGSSVTTVTTTLAPRKPGGFTVTFTSKVGSVDEIYLQEFLVVTRYFGALRTGFAGVWSPFEAEYAVVGDELALVRESLADPELVVGFSTYFSQKSAYRLPTSEGLPIFYTPRVGLYTGLALVSPGGTEEPVSFLRSVYLGVDWEFSPHFSLTTAVGMRRAKEPLPPFAVGATVPEDTEWGAFVPKPALAVMINVTPWYFRQLGGPFESVGSQ